MAILGASNKSERYSFLALRKLREHGHNAIPIHPLLEEIDGVPVIADLDKITEPIDTLTVYVGKNISDKQREKIIKLNPKRVIFNPGAENPDLERDLNGHGIYVQNACTLVLLGTGQF